MNCILYTNYKILLFISIFNQFLSVLIIFENENEIFKRIKWYKKKIEICYKKGLKIIFKLILISIIK